MTTSAQNALKQLQQGNRRFASGRMERNVALNQMERGKMVGEQQPIAIVSGCSDSRVPPEMIFDQGLGDVFVVRIVGNVATPSQIGSIEFAVERLGTYLVVVLGHSDCGAIQAALGDIARPSTGRSPHIDSIADCIRPTILPLLEATAGEDKETLARAAVAANIRASVGLLNVGSNILVPLIASDGLVVVGAEYPLQTGTVRFLNDLLTTASSDSAGADTVLAKHDENYMAPEVADSLAKTRAANAAAESNP